MVEVKVMMKCWDSQMAEKKDLETLRHLAEMKSKASVKRSPLAEMISKEMMKCWGSQRAEKKHSE